MHILRHLFAICFAAGLASFSASAETPNEIAELFGRADAIGNPQLSPDGKHLAVECSPQVKLTVCIFDLEGGSSIVVPSLEDVRLTDHYWASRDRLILDVEVFKTLRTSDGLRDYTFERAVVFDLDKQKPNMLMRDQGGYIDANNLAAIGTDPNSLIFSMYQRLGGGVYLSLLNVNLKTGKSKRFGTASADAVGAVLSPAGDLIAELLYSRAPNNTYSVSLLANKKEIFRQDNLTVDPPSIWGLDNTGKNIVINFDAGEPFGLHRMSLDDGSLTPIKFSGSVPGALAWPIYDKRANRIVGFELPGDQTRQVIEDEKLSGQIKAIAPAMQGASVTLESWTDDRSQSVVRVEQTGSPAEFYLFEADKGALSPVGNVAPHLDGRTLGKIEPISYSARDGLKIEGYLTLPPGKTRADGPFPMILLPHGGPESRDMAGFDWWAQAYAAAGYAVLQPNFRGSSGYGQDFLRAGFGEFGGKMVLDVLDGGDWAVSEGIARKGEMCAVGASYGGYSALMAGLHAPSDIKCIVAVNAVTNPFALLGEYSNKSIGANYLERYLGVGIFDTREARDTILPVARASEYRMPVLVIGSEEDSTVSFEQTEQFVRAARDTGKVQLVELSGEDHYLRSTRARHDVLQNSLALLGQHLPAN